MRLLLVALLGGLGFGVASCGDASTSLDRTISTGRDGSVVVSTPDGTITEFGIVTGSFSFRVVTNPDGTCTTIEQDGKDKPTRTTGPCP